MHNPLLDDNSVSPPPTHSGAGERRRVLVTEQRASRDVAVKVRGGCGVHRGEVIVQTRTLAGVRWPRPGQSSTAINDSLGYPEGLDRSPAYPGLRADTTAFDAIILPQRGEAERPAPARVRPALPANIPLPSPGNEHRRGCGGGG